MGSLALRPALLLCGNSRPRVAATPLPHATEAHGQLLGRDFNPLDLLLLLRTDRPRFSTCTGENRGLSPVVPCCLHGLMREGRREPVLYSTRFRDRGLTPFSR